MGFTTQEHFIGSGKSAGITLVTFTEQETGLPAGRGSVFLSRDNGQSFSELFVHKSSRTPRGHNCTLLVPFEGDEVYVTTYYRVGDEISFVDKIKPVTHHTLAKSDTAPLTAVTRLTPAQLLEIAEVRKLM